MYGGSVVIRREKIGRATVGCGTGSGDVEQIIGSICILAKVLIISDVSRKTYLRA